MKTSLILDDRIFEDARNESVKTGRSLSEIISQWASLGRSLLKKKTRKPSNFKAADLGSQKIDITNRKEWMEELEDDSS
ncbi:MAG: hypothetical protein A3F16_00945 [Deltaproteobacteria bacterium RIFCSPHIGHO2_12_FULL_43_9]|nr:MAG: hypothetical protein A3F16_00945 [Deltaproteobacteria bacterium RIFCSPHIGHO2_12_FULL_43_9]